MEEARARFLRSRNREKSIFTQNLCGISTCDKNKVWIISCGDIINIPTSILRSVAAIVRACIEEFCKSTAWSAATQCFVNIYGGRLNYSLSDQVDIDLPKVCDRSIIFGWTLSRSRQWMISHLVDIVQMYVLYCSERAGNLLSGNLLTICRKFGQFQSRR